MTVEAFTLIELLIVVAIISIIAAIAVPGLLRARMTGNETSAIVSLKAATSSQVAYSASCGAGGYATSYPVLGTPPAAGSRKRSSQPTWARPPRRRRAATTSRSAPAASAAAGPNDCNGTATTTGYYASATPQAFGTTGSALVRDQCREHHLAVERCRRADRAVWRAQPRPFSRRARKARAQGTASGPSSKDCGTN